MITTDRKPATDNTLKHSWGMRFQAAREAMNLSEKDAANRLHLKPHIINIIETERFDQGPPVIFMRGYIRSYGRLLNLPEKDLTQALAQFDFGSPIAPPVTTQFRMRENPSNSSSIWSTAFVVLVLTALVGVWWWNSHVRNAPVVDLAAAQAPAEVTPLTTAAVTPAATPEATATAAPVATAMNNTAQPAVTAPAVSTVASAPAAAAPAPAAATTIDIPPSPTANDTTSQSAATTPAPAQPDVATNTATPAVASQAPADQTSADAATADDAAEDQPTPPKTHTSKVKLPNLADSEMAVPDEDQDNEPSE
jgi:cytoskeleton protein RodZ